MKTVFLICGTLFSLLVQGQVVNTGQSATTNTEVPQSRSKKNNAPVLSSGEVIAGDTASIPTNTAPELKPASPATQGKKTKSPKKH